MVVRRLSRGEGAGGHMTDPREAAAAAYGASSAVSTEQMLDACLAFYRTIFSKTDGDAALKAMNDAVDAGKETFWLT
jgi:hypothetical protein